MITPNRRNNQIFISYRREDNQGVTGRIYDRLVQKFGKEAIFKDLDSIPLGVDFKQHIDAIMQECAVVLVVIGDRWAGETRKPVRRRLDDPEDIVRIEIESALNRNIRVIPLLIQGVSMPTETSLPDSLKGLAARHGTTIGNDPHFHTDMERLIRDLEVCFEIAQCEEDGPSSSARDLPDTSKPKETAALGRTIPEEETPTTFTEIPTGKAVRSKSVRSRRLSWPGVLGYVLALAIAVGFLALVYRMNQTPHLVTQDELKTALGNAKNTIRASGFLISAVEPDLIVNKSKRLPNFNTEVLMVDPLNLNVVCERMNDEGSQSTYGKILLKLRSLHNNAGGLIGNRLKVGLTDAYPTMSVIMVDEDLYAYFYTYNQFGTASPILKFANYAKDERAKVFVDHYNNLRATARILVEADFERYERADLNHTCPPPSRPDTTPSPKPTS